MPLEAVLESQVSQHEGTRNGRKRLRIPKIMGEGTQNIEIRGENDPQ
jgi:hypothetical protein